MVFCLASWSGWGKHKDFNLNMWIRDRRYPQEKNISIPSAPPCADPGPTSPQPLSVVPSPSLLPLRLASLVPGGPFLLLAPFPHAGLTQRLLEGIRSLLPAPFFLWGGRSPFPCGLGCVGGAVQGLTRPHGPTSHHDHAELCVQLSPHPGRNPPCPGPPEVLALPSLLPLACGLVITFFND